MLGLKKTVLAASAIAALMAAAPARALGLFLPWILGRHVVAAVVGLATLPLAVASSVGEPATSYPPPPAYGGPRGYYAPRNYYGPPPAYYTGNQGYYRPAAAYARSAPRYYGSSRGYYAPSTRYTGAYGAHVPNQSGRLSYRRR